MIEDVNKFSDLLIVSRGNRTKKSIAYAIGVSVETIERWEGSRPKIVLPKEDMLPEISDVYKIELLVLREAWSKSKSVLDRIFLARRVKRPKGPSPVVFSGGSYNPNCKR